MKLPVVVGVDPGLATTGFGFVYMEDDGSLQPIHYGVILTPAGLPLEQRLLQLYEEFHQLVDEYKPSGAAVEKLFFQKNVKTAISVAHARGIILLVLAEFGLKVTEYTPLEIKQTISGYGGADKNQMQQMVRLLLRLDDIPRPDDAADALAAAICHLHSSRFNDLAIP